MPGVRVRKLFGVLIVTVAFAASDESNTEGARMRTDGTREGMNGQQLAVCYCLVLCYFAGYLATAEQVIALHAFTPTAALLGSIHHIH